MTTIHNMLAAIADPTKHLLAALDYEMNAGDLEPLDDETSLGFALRMVAKIGHLKYLMAQNMKALEEALPPPRQAAALAWAIEIVTAWGGHVSMPTVRASSIPGSTWEEAAATIGAEFTYDTGSSMIDMRSKKIGAMQPHEKIQP